MSPLVILRILGLTAMLAFLLAALAFALFGQNSDGTGIAFFASIGGGIMGAIAGAAAEIATALRAKHSR